MLVHAELGCYTYNYWRRLGGEVEGLKVKKMKWEMSGEEEVLGFKKRRENKPSASTLAIDWTVHSGQS